MPEIERSHGYAVVMIEEEYGYKHWMWNTEKTKEEFLTWWRNLESVSEYFWGADRLPFGKIVQLYPYDDDFHMDVVANNHNFYAKSWNEPYNENEELLADFFMHLHTDGDSYICPPNQEGEEDKVIYHKGYDPNYYQG